MDGRTMGGIVPGPAADGDGLSCTLDWCAEGSTPGSYVGARPGSCITRGRPASFT